RVRGDGSSPAASSPQPSSRARPPSCSALSSCCGSPSGSGGSLGRSAPPRSLSTRAIETFIHGNAAGSLGIGVVVPAATRSILEEADGRLWTAVRLTLATYHGDWLALFGKEVFKLRAIFS